MTVGSFAATPAKLPRSSTPPPPDVSSMLEIVLVIFATACAVAFAQWWKGPEIPR